MLDYEADSWSSRRFMKMSSRLLSRVPVGEVDERLEAEP
jgi:hypothetical protein